MYIMGMALQRDNGSACCCQVFEQIWLPKKVTTDTFTSELRMRRGALLIFCAPAALIKGFPLPPAWHRCTLRNKQTAVFSPSPSEIGWAAKLGMQA